MSKSMLMFFLLAPCLRQWLWKRILDRSVTLIVFAPNYQLLGREKSQPEADESRLHVYRMLMGPTNLFLPGKHFQVFEEIAGN